MTGIARSVMISGSQFLKMTMVGSAAFLAMNFAASAAVDFEVTIRPILQEYCLTCHSTEKQKGDLDMEAALTPAAIRQHPKIWQNVQEQMLSGEKIFHQILNFSWLYSFYQTIFDQFC